jgi:RNA polymerase sigma-70 factor (ECF subfamily)
MDAGEGPGQPGSPTDLWSTEGIGRVYREQADRLWRALFAFTGNREIASDAVAEAFAQLLRRGAAVHSPARWVWKAAFAIAKGELQRVSQSSLLDVEHGYEPTEPAWHLREALLEVSPAQRASLVLHYYAGYPTRDIADMIDSTPASVRVHLYRGRRHLRLLLEEVGHRLPASSRSGRCTS